MPPKVIIRIRPSVRVDGIHMPAAEKGELAAWVVWYGGRFLLVVAIVYAVVKVGDWLFRVL